MVFEKVKEIICTQFEVSEDRINEETSFLDDLDADSLDVVELAMSIEEAFDLPEISEDDIKSIRTVGDLVNYIMKAQG